MGFAFFPKNLDFFRCDLDKNPLRSLIFRFSNVIQFQRAGGGNGLKSRAFTQRYLARKWHVLYAHAKTGSSFVIAYTRGGSPMLPPLWKK